MSFLNGKKSTKEITGEGNQRIGILNGLFTNSNVGTVRLSLMNCTCTPRSRVWGTESDSSRHPAKARTLSLVKCDDALSCKTRYRDDLMKRRRGVLASQSMVNAMKFKDSSALEIFTLEEDATTTAAIYKGGS